MKVNRLLLIVSLLLLVLGLQGQGSTSSSVSGRISDAGGNPMIAATVMVTDQSTGTQYGSVSDNAGYFRIPNIQVGGPYSLRITFVGHEPYERTGLYFSLGQTHHIEITMSATAQALGKATVVGTRNDLFDGTRTGAETTVSNEEINVMPSVGRSVTDIVRLSPQARVTQDGGVEIAGANNRFNSIYIDGAVNNDVFGLAATGTNGGQTGISPFSIDIIEQVSVQIAPYDVTMGGFTGAGINAVTRRGRNEFQGSAYYIMRNEKLAGLTPTDDENTERTQLDEFSSNTYGFRLGGPIVKNKLFFFLNAEIQKDETPQPWSFSDYNGSATEAELQQLVNHLNELGYDPGAYTNVIRSLNGQKFFGRIDWNINNKNRLMVRHQYTRAELTSPSNSSPTNIRFANSGIFFPSTTNTSAFELNSRLNNNVTNKLILGYTSVRDDRNPMGDNFPYVRIKDGSSNIYFGSEQFSTANQLNQDIITLSNHLEYSRGKHTISFGTHNEYYNIYNLFIRQNFGSYQFNSLDDFLTGQPAYQYDRTFSAVDDVTGDGSKAAAEFRALQLGFYVQDQIQVNKKLRITAGVRLDIPMFLDQPMLNQDFNDHVIPILEDNGWDLQGAKTGQTPKPSLMVNPRFGFNYDVDGNKEFQIRGGAGLFTSRIPYVWPGASFQNNAIMTGGMRVTTAGAPELIFNPNWDQQPTTPLTQPSGQVDIFAENFKFPQVFRTSIGADKKLPYGFIGSIEMVYTKTINNILYHNLRYIQTDSLTGTGDNRPIYSSVNLGKDPETDANRRYTDIILGTNTSKGYTYNITAQLQKSFHENLITRVAYTFGRAMSMNDGVSSQNSSNWRVPNVRGNNELDLSFSNFDMGHRIIGLVSYKKEFIKNTATSISIFYTGQSGERFSYGYADGFRTPSNQTQYLGENNLSLELMYVPNNQDDIVLVDIKDNDGNIISSASEQWNALNDYIENDPYLKSRKGQYVERNHSRVPFMHMFDLRIAQDFFIVANGKRNTLQVSLDIFNLGNMLHQGWGRIYYASGAYYNNYPLLKFEGFEPDPNDPSKFTNTPRFSYTPSKSGNPYAIDDRGILSSRWQGQLTIRYIFN